MKDELFVSWEEAVNWLLSQPDKQELVRDCYFDRSVFEAADRYARSPEWQSIQRYLPNHVGKALDVGAGRGIASYALASDGWSVDAIEPDPSDLVGAGAIDQLSREFQLPVKVHSEFGEKIPFEDASYDLVFARQVLHHANDLNQLCRELYRVLKPGGYMIAVRDHVISKPRDLDAFYQVHPLHYLYGGENAYTLKQYLFSMTSAGFEVENTIKSFDDVINFAPYTYQTLRDEIQDRIRKVPLFGRVVSSTLTNDVTFPMLLKLLSNFDSRPGRLVSFVCSKPKAE